MFNQIKIINCEEVFFSTFLCFYACYGEDAYAEAEAIRSVRSINSDWKFILRDEQQAFKSDYNDSSWRTLDVPHDWAFENGYSKIGDLSTITLGKLIRMFGRNIAQTTFEKIKLFETPLLKIATDLLNQQKDNREFEIYIDRANKKTLQEIADKHGLTRERVRQIEAKFFRQFAPLFGSLIEQHMTNNNLSYILTQDVLEFSTTMRLIQ